MPSLSRRRCSPRPSLRRGARRARRSRAGGSHRPSRPALSHALHTDLACSISWRAVQPHPTAFLIQHAFARSLSSWRRKGAWEIQLQAKSAAVKTWCQDHGDNVMTTAATCTSDSRARSPPPLTNSRRPTSDHKKGPRVLRGPASD